MGALVRTLDRECSWTIREAATTSLGGGASGFIPRRRTAIPLGTHLAKVEHSP